MFTISFAPVALVLAATVVAVAWPLLALPRVRRVLLCAGGSCCIGCGAFVFSLVAAGQMSVVVAAEPAEAAEEESSAPGSQSPGIEAPAIEVLDSDTAAPASLSEEPQIEPASPTVIIPPGRPAWVETDLNESAPVHSLSVTSEPRHSKAEARRQLDEALVRETSQYIADYLHSPLAGKFISFDARTIKQRFVKPENLYSETLEHSWGSTYQSHALLECGPELRDELDSRWAKVRATSRLTQLGLFSGAALLLLGSVCGYFRLDNATRGYYTGRLQLLAAAAILAVVGVGVFVARGITWM
ncbi:MAG: hypothetical protein WD872_21715 [Pirellulaceae bacterium]